MSKQENYVAHEVGKIRYRYLRDSKRNPYATVCIVNVDDDKEPVRIGWSLCARMDQFNKKLGRTIALNRALHDNWYNFVPPKRIKKDVMDMYYDCLAKQKGAIEIKCGHDIAKKDISELSERLMNRAKRIDIVFKGQTSKDNWRCVNDGS